MNRNNRSAAGGGLNQTIRQIIVGAALAALSSAGSTQAPPVIQVTDEAGAEALRRAVAGLDSPAAIATALVDQRLRPFLPPDMDLRRAAEQSLARHQEYVALHPDRLGGILAVASDLRLLGRPQEALEILEVARERVEASEGFTDLSILRNWWWDSLAKTNLSLVRYEATVAAYRQGVDADENGQANVSQVINLASTQLGFGRPEEALRTLAALQEQGNLSPYGELQARTISGCAKARLDRMREATEDLSYVSANARNDPQAEANLMVCMGEIEGAARSVIRQLDDPQARTHLLLRLSEYDDPPVPPPTDPDEAKWDALLLRPDVRAAIDRAGGLQRFPVQSGEW